MIDCNITTNYFSEKARMTNKCENDCRNCKLSCENNTIGIDCSKLETLHNEFVIEIVQKWSDTHPFKTYLSDFMEKFPNAILDKDKTPEDICPEELGYCEEAGCDHKCVICWNRPLK